MKRFGMIGLVCVGFIAGIFFVYSCGGSGGSSVLAEITDVSSLVSELQNIDASLTTIAGNESQKDVRSFYVRLQNSNSYQANWLTLGASESFIITDLVSTGSDGYFVISVDGGENRSLITTYTNSSTFNFSNGIKFNPNETIKLSSSNQQDIILSGYLITL